MTVRTMDQFRGKQTVLVVTANRFLGESLIRLFRSDKAFRLLGPIEFSRRIAEVVSETNPDIVVVSTAWNEAAFAATHVIREIEPRVKILMIGMEDDEEMFLNAVRAGAHGYLLKEAPAKQILMAAHRLSRNFVVCPEHLEQVVFRFVASVPRLATAWGRRATELTPREQQLTGLIAQGLANKEIAERLNLSLHTVKNHVHSVLRKTGSRNRSALGRPAPFAEKASAAKVVSHYPA